MISASDLSKHYGDQTLFEEAYFTIGSGEHVGLVGRNGHGKTTLFRIITGVEEPDTGKINIPKDYTIGYLDQQLNFTKDTVIEEGSLGLPENEKDAKWKVEKILSGLGFSEEDMQRPISEFSGGYQVRLALAKVLVSNPDMLLLDEPTNFLDIISIRWLENFLRAWRGELIVISHDRDFMDSVTDHILGIHRHKMRKMKGKTSRYYRQVAKDEEVYENRRINDEKRREQMQDHINRFRAKARHARGIQSHIKSLEKMDKMSKLDKVQDLSFSFNREPFEARRLLEAKNINFSYEEDKPYLIENFSFALERGDKICIAGKNGKGKTTLMKILAGALEPVSGKIKEHPKVVKAYFEQSNTVTLDKNNSIEEELASSCNQCSRTAVRNICGAMMFSGNTALKKVGVLSGGEMCRVLLGKLLLAPSNLLLLDEPTHHLDMQAAQAMMDAVSNFKGTAIIVTHDEHFLSQVATKVIAFKDDGIKVFPGNYGEFLEQMGWDEEGSVQKEVSSKASEDITPKEARRLRAEARALRAKRLGPVEKEIKRLEKEIGKADDMTDEVNDALVKASEKQDASKISELSKKLSELQEKTDNLYAELEEKMEQCENIKRELGEE